MFMLKKYVIHKRAILAAFAVSFILFCTLIFFVIPSRKITSPLAETIDSTAVLSETSIGGTQPVPSPNQSHLGIVLFGYGGAGHDGGYLTDAIQVLYVDFEKAQINLLSIPRDLWVKLPGGNEVKINAVLSNAATSKKALIETGASGLKKIVTEITGLPIDYFIGVDFVGFERAIGINLKGIEVSVAETLDDPWYPIKGEELNTCNMSPEVIKDVHAKYSGFELERQFTCRYKHLHFEKGPSHMEGGDALEYVRSRHGSADGDISRGKRQQEVLKAIRQKLFSLEALDKLPGFFTEIIKHTQTDISLDIIQYLLPVLKKSRDFKLVTVNLATTNVLSTATSNMGGAIIFPKEGNFKWDQIQEFINNQIN